MIYEPDPIERVWNDAGSHPQYHERIKQQLAKMWPTLYKALEEKYGIERQTN